MGNFSNIPSGKQENADFNIHRGYFGIVKEGDTIPVGGSIFSNSADSFLTIDENSPISEVFTEEKFKEALASSHEAISGWLKQSNIEISTDFFFLLQNIQIKVNKNMQVDDSKSHSSERKGKYAEKNTLMLSDLVGISECAERAALGTVLLNNFGKRAYYMSGVYHYSLEKDGENHSWIVMPGENGGTYIFDIARPIVFSNGSIIPSIYKVEGELSEEFFAGSDNKFVKGKNIITKRYGFFGVSDEPRMTTDVPNVVDSILSQ